MKGATDRSNQALTYCSELFLRFNFSMTFAELVSMREHRESRVDSTKTRERQRPQWELNGEGLVEQVAMGETESLDVGLRAAVLIMSSD